VLCPGGMLVSTSPSACPVASPAALTPPAPPPGGTNRGRPGVRAAGSGPSGAATICLRLPRGGAGQTTPPTIRAHRPAGGYEPRPVVEPPRSRLIAHRLEGRPDLGREQLRLFPRREVATPVHLVEVGELGVDGLDPAARARKTSPGNVVKPTGIETSGGAWPAARAWARPASQYARAAEAPVPVNQYSVMLSTILSRVRLPVGWSSRKAPEIL
jgi:hypothetical protein